MRIAMLGHKRIPSREGGVEIVVEELAVRMVEKGHEVTCYNRRGHHVSGKEFDSDYRGAYKGVVLKTVPTMRRKGLAAMTASFFAAIFAAVGRYDVVHFHAEGPCAMLWLPKLLGKRCIATVHGLDHQRSKWGWLARNYIMLGEKCAVKCADEIIVLSKNVQKYFMEKYGRKTLYVPNGMASAELREAQLIESQLDLASEKYILYLGRITPEKGIHYLIDAYKRMNTDLKLVIAGGESDSVEYFSRLKQMAAPCRDIVFTGFVQGRMLEELYSNAFCYVLPSDLEGMPLSLLEALSYGNCCVVSDIEECREVVGEKGVIFRKSDVQDLADKLTWVCENMQITPEYRRSIAKYARGRLSWNDVANRTLEIYKGING